MKTFTEYRQVEHEYYESFDGKRFENKDECRRYEDEMMQPEVLAANNVPHAIMSQDWVHPYANEDELYVVFFPRSREDLTAIETWAKFNNVLFVANEIESVEPVIFDAYGYSINHYFPEESLMRLEDLNYACGTVSDLKRSLSESVDAMMNTAEKFMRMNNGQD